jgi:putative aminopeptidase FrvX
MRPRPLSPLRRVPGSCPAADSTRTRKRLLAIAARLLQHPAAPYHEHAVRGEVEAICREHDLAFRRDRFGNVWVRLRRGAPSRPLALAAHLDHPGFTIVRRLSRTRFRARFLGGVPRRYFRPGLPVRLMPGGIAATLQANSGEDVEWALRASHLPPAPPEFAVWELPDFELRGSRLHARACDDLVGVAAVLTMLAELRESRGPVNVLGLISRAEEVGFHGALTMAAAPELPKGTFVVSLETSRELPPAAMGRGVILRVGDRASVFNPEAARFLGEVAEQLRSGGAGFRFQRALMSGGTCEATAYQEHGFQTAAVCVALGNYHNCGARGRIAAEYVDIRDACGMVELLVAVARQMPNYHRWTGRLPARLATLLREGRRRLRASP